MAILIAVTTASNSLAADYRLAAAGMPGSPEYRLAEGICASLALDNKEITCHVVPENDAEASLQALVKNEADFALTYSQYVGAEMVRPGSDHDIRTIAGLYDLYLMAGVSKKRKANTLDDLLGARMRIDMPGTLSRQAADYLFSEMDITYQRFTSVAELPESQTSSQICPDDIDAIVALAYQRSSLMDAFINKCGGRLLNIPEDIRGQYRLDHPGFRSVGLSSGTFVRLRYPVATLGAQMMLVTKAQQDDKPVIALASVIAHDGQQLRRISPIVEPDSWKNTPLFTQLPLHPATGFIYSGK